MFECQDFRENERNRNEPSSTIKPYFCPSIQAINSAYFSEFLVLSNDISVNFLCQNRAINILC